MEEMSSWRVSISFSVFIKTASFPAAMVMQREGEREMMRLNMKFDEKSLLHILKSIPKSSNREIYCYRTTIMNYSTSEILKFWATSRKTQGI
jgi:hypothetical protein